MNFQLYLAMLMVVIQEEQAIKAEHVGDKVTLEPIPIGKYLIEESEVSRVGPGTESFWQILGGMVSDSIQEEQAVKGVGVGQSVWVQPLHIGANYIWSGLGGGPIEVIRVS